MSDNPFRPDGDLRKEADEILKDAIIERDKIIISPKNEDSNGDAQHQTENHPTIQNINGEIEKKGDIESKAQNGEGPVVVELTKEMVVQPADPLTVEHVNIEQKKKGCCELM